MDRLRAAAGATVLALALAGALGGERPRAAAASPVAGRPRRDAELALERRADSLDARLTALERTLRVGRGEPRRQGDLTRRYALLRQREAALAEAAMAWLRYVPAGNPIAGGRLASAFVAARYHPILHVVKPHVGVDIAAAEGTPVHATADGRVAADAVNPTYGLAVDVVHGTSGFITRYAHLRAIAVSPGQAVRRGDVVGWVGHTGLATGSHCHYEVFYRGWRRDPSEFWDADVSGRPLAPTD